LSIGHGPIIAHTFTAFHCPPSSLDPASHGNQTKA
jgi:hypothetical protein